MLKIIHFADLHLNAPLSSRVRWDIANRLRETKFQVLDRIIELANQRQADLILVAGDLFDSRFADEKTLRFLQDRFSRTVAQVFIAAGNHDAGAFRELSGDNIHLFGTEMECCTLPKKGCCVYGRSFSGETEHSGLLQNFRVSNPEMLNLMVMHGDLQRESDYNPITREEIRHSGLDYLALGHIHNEKEIRREGQTYYGYCGIPQPHSFKDALAPSVTYIEISKEEFHSEYIDVSAFRFCRLTISVSACRTVYDICEQILSATEGQEREKHLFEILLEGELPEGFGLDVRQLEKELSQAFLHLEIKDGTRLAIEPETLALEQTLRGAFVRAVQGDSALSGEERQAILECGIHALNPLVTKEELL